MSGIWAYIARRVLFMVPTLIGIVTISFIIIQFVPGGPIDQIQARMAGQALEATATISGSTGGGADAAAGGLVPTGELDPRRSRSWRSNMASISRCSPAISRCSGISPVSISAPASSRTSRS